MADGTIFIDIDMPVNQVKSDSQEIEDILKRIGNNAGNELDDSFKKNLDKVKDEANKTHNYIKEHLNNKIEVPIDDRSIIKFKKNLDKVKDEKLKIPIKGSTSDFDKKTKEIKATKIPSFIIPFKGNNSDLKEKIHDAKERIKNFPKSHTFLLEAKDKASSVLSKIGRKTDETREKTSRFKEVFMGTFIGGIASNAVQNAWGHLTGWIGEAINSAKEYSLEQQTMNATWLTLTSNASKGKAIVNQINDMAAAANNSTKMVDGLFQSFYAINNNADLTGKLTKSVLTLQDAFGQSDAAVENFGTQYGQMLANGKVSAQDMMSFVNTFPKIRTELLKTMQEQTHNHNLTMKQMNDMMSQGKISADMMNKTIMRMGEHYKEATDNFTKTIPGMLRTIKSTMPRLMSAISDPITKMSNPIIGALSDWVTSNKTKTEFEKIGNTFSKGLNGTIDAFIGKGSNSSQKAADGLDRSLEHINTWISNIFKFLENHAGTIKGLVTDTGSILKTIGSTIWSDFANIITTIADMFGLTNSNSKKARGPLEKIGDVVHALAKNKGAVQAIAHAIVTIATIKTLNNVISPLRDLANMKIGKGTLLDVMKGGIDGSKFGGAFQSLKSAGGFKGLSTLGKITLGASVAFDAAKIGKDFYDAITSSKISVKEKKYGSGIGGLVGMAIGAELGGPAGAVIGEELGSKIGEKAAPKAMSGWQKAWDYLTKPKNKKPKLSPTGRKVADFINDANGDDGPRHREREKAQEKNDEKSSAFWKGIFNNLTPKTNLPNLNGKVDLGLGSMFRNTPKVDVGKWVNGIKKDLGKIKWPKIKGPNFHFPKIDVVKWFDGIKEKFKKLNFKNLLNNHKKGGLFGNIKLPKLDVTSWGKNLIKKIKKIKLPKFKVPKIDFKKAFNGFKEVNKTWDGIKRKTSTVWGKIKDTVVNKSKDGSKKANSSFKDLKKKMDNVGDDIYKGWKSTWNSVKNFFGDIWDKIKDLGKKGLNSVIGLINGGISGIDTVIGAFGGSKDAIKQIKKLASGTGYSGGARNAIVSPTLAMVNDGFDSPETGNKEALYRPATGELGIFQGRNVLTKLYPGDEIINASDTRDLMRSAGVKHFAKGTGFVESVKDNVTSWASGVGSWIGQKTAGLKKWFDQAKKIIKSPTKVLDDMMSFKDIFSGTAMKEMGKGLFKESKNAATSWWSQLWSIVSSKLDDGSVGSSNGLIAAAQKYGEGKPYVWGSHGPESFDCSGLVQYTVEHYLHKSLPAPSSNQFQMTKAVDDPEPGDLVFFGNGGSNHVGFYMGGGKYYSAQSPDASPNIGVGNVADVHEGPVSYRRIPGVSPKKLEDAVKGKGKATKSGKTSLSNKMIEEQVGSGFWKLIKKLATLFGDSGMPNVSGNAKAWTSYIKKAAEQMHTSVTSSDISKIVSMIAAESNGDAGVTQKVWDVNMANGNPAQGLLQFIPQTFSAFAVKGHSKIKNGYDQLLALFNDSNWKNDIHFGGGWGPTGHRRFANGGTVYNEELVRVAEEGSEKIINPRRPSADALNVESIKETAVHQPASYSAKLAKLIDLGKVKHSSANGYAAINYQGQLEDGSASNISNITQSQKVSGNTVITVHLDSNKIVKATFPKIKLLQQKELDIVESGGYA